METAKKSCTGRRRNSFPAKSADSIMKLENMRNCVSSGALITTAAISLSQVTPLKQENLYSPKNCILDTSFKKIGIVRVRLVSSKSILEFVAPRRLWIFGFSLYFFNPASAEFLRFEH